jgi:hypothetical protein
VQDDTGVDQFRRRDDADSLACPDSVDSREEPVIETPVPSQSAVDTPAVLQE